jgi:DNA-binding GntR family transcriptional regulator
VPPRTPASGQISQAERAYQEIKWRIVYGHYKPGAHLSEATLARVHRTSRTPIREALARLSEEQYVVWDAGRGFLIAPVTVSRIRDTFHVRRLLEGAAAAGAAEMATPDEIRGMAGLAEYTTRAVTLTATGRRWREISSSTLPSPPRATTSCSWISSVSA